MASGGWDSGQDIYLWEHGVAVEPWPEPVDGKRLLDELESLIARFAVLPKWAAPTLALWVVHTYAFHLRLVATYVGIESPAKRCGKTTLLTILCGLVNRPVVASNISSPAFYRVIEEKKPTLMIDEADTVLHRNKELHGILNSGYTRRTGYVIRMTPSKVSNKPAVQNGDGQVQNGEAKAKEQAGGTERGGMQLARFSSWCPKAIATIKHLPETLADRCIVLTMQRKSSREKCERLRNMDGEELRRKCARFVQDHAREIAKAIPEIPEDLNDRAADIWEPLLAVADLAGKEWAEKARQAAVGLTAKAQEDNPIGSLLVDLFLLLTEQECTKGNEWMQAQGVRIFSRDLVASLNSYNDRPWMSLRRGKEVTETWLSQQLRPYGVRPRTVWIGERSAKGYLREDFEEVFRRYLPKSEVWAILNEAKSADEEKPTVVVIKAGEGSESGGLKPE
jgi:hypothetical protein